MKTVKVLVEERDALAFEAKGMYEAAQNASREFNADEEKRFKEITNESTGLIAQLDVQIKEAREREDAILKVAEREGRKATVERLNEITSSRAPSRVLPTNGELPNVEEQQDRIYVRAARLKAFKNERQAYDAGMWFRSVVSRLFHGGVDKQAELHCHRRGMDIEAAAKEATGAAGGYLVPAPIAQTIIDVRENVGVARRVCEIQPMTADTISIPKRAGGLTVYYPDELASITDSTKNWGQVSLIARKRAVATKVSQELQDDALISVVDNAVTEMAYALALQEDNELINGTGASTYGTVQGLLSAIGSAGVSTAAASTTWGAITLAEIMTAMSLLPDRFNRSPVWICSTNFYWAVFARLLASGGGNAINDLSAGPGGMKTFLGVPVYTTSQMPTATATNTKCALFGQFDMGVILGDRTGIRVGRDESTGFLSDYTTLKATSRYDIQVHEPGDGTNPGAYIAFSTHS